MGCGRLLRLLSWFFMASLLACATTQEPSDSDPSDATDAADTTDPADASDSSDPSDSSDATQPQDPCADAVFDSNYKAWPGEDWETTCPQVQNIDPVKLEAAYDYAFKPEYNTQSVLVIRNGAIVAEWYANGKTRDDHVTSWSVAKSFLSAIVGIAVELGDLPSVDEPLATYIPEFQGTDKEAITFRHALQMRSGLEPHESDNIYIQSDQLAWGIEREVAEAPGGTWEYQNGDSMLVSRGIEAAIGRPFIEYANEVLLEPLGMDSKWWTDSVGNALGYCCIDATARDFARFGLLFSRTGDWNGTNLVPPAWVVESTSPTAADMDYGLHWWSFSDGSYFAAIGAKGQYIWVFPYFDLIILRNGLYEKRGPADDYSVLGGTYHDTEDPGDFDTAELISIIFDAVIDNPFN